MKKLLLISTIILGLAITPELVNAQNITANFLNTNVCLNNPTCFTDLSTSPNFPITSWFWDFGDATGTSTMQNPCYTYAQPGNYTVCLIVLNSNADSNMVCQPITVNVCTSVKSISKNTSINIFPNPINSISILKIDNNLSANFKINIYDAFGKTVKSFNLNQNELELRKSEFKSGIYFISIQDENGSFYNKKFVVN